MPTTTAAMHNGISQTGSAYFAQQSPSFVIADHDGITAQVKWYGSLDPTSQTLSSNAGKAQAAVSGVSLVKKPVPGDVSRHDTPTSVFDIFNSLSIAPGTTGQPYAEQHIAEPAGHHPGLTDIPHMHDSSMMYQDMDPDDGWLEEFATSQVAAAQASSADAADLPGKHVAMPTRETDVPEGADSNQSSCPEAASAQASSQVDLPAYQALC